MKVYHVACSLEGKFKNLQDAKNYYSGLLYPYIPKTAGEHEDKSIPRICVAPTVEDCLTGIKLVGRLRRCLAANEDAMSYETLGLEVYPVIILEFDVPMNLLYKPNKHQVPDVDITNEYWLTRPVKASKVMLKWLNPRSIIWEETYRPEMWYKCKKVTFTRSVKGRNHPWLNGRGSILESSEQEPVYTDQMHR